MPLTTIPTMKLIANTTTHAPMMFSIFAWKIVQARLNTSPMSSGVGTICPAAAPNGGPPR